jgi:high-affinity iron transporter
MLVAAVFVITMVIFMMRTARKLKGEIETKVGSLAADGGSKWGLFAFIFLMVFREGVETVVILSGVSLDSTELMSFLGTLMGVALAVVFGVMFVKGSVKVDLRKFFRVTTVILFFVAAQLIISGFHELAESGVLPSSKREMAIIGPIVRNDYFFSITMLALVVLMVLMEYRRRKPAAGPPAGSKAEGRKVEFTARRERFWANAVMSTAFIFIFMVTAEFIYAKSTTALSDAAPITFDAAGNATILTKTLAEGDLARYAANVDGVNMRFLLYRKPDGKVASLFDACEICGSVGFYKGAQGLICKNCAAPINPQSVGQSGGCNPIPLHAIQDGDSVVINIADLRPQLAQFSH